MKKRRRKIMELKKLIKLLDAEFDVGKVFDTWIWMFDDLFVKHSLPEFREKNLHTGLVIKNGDTVKVIYTAFAPSKYVLEQIKKKGIKGSLLVVKHPFDWNGRAYGFINFTEADYDLMEEMQISLYSLHTPLDKNRNDKVVSTAYGFAKVIGLKVEREFAEESENNPELYLGLIGTLEDPNFDALVKRLSKEFNYKVKTIKKNNKVGKVAIATGGGFVPRVVSEAKMLGVNTYITGIITPNKSEYDKENYPKNFKQINKLGINLIGCSHYLTEKWAMIFSLPYFSQFCKAEFIEDNNALKRLE